MKTAKEVSDKVREYKDEKIGEIVENITNRFEDLAKKGGNRTIRYQIPIDNLSDDAIKNRIRMVISELESLGFYSTYAGKDDWSFYPILVVSIDSFSKLEKFLYRIGII